MNEMIERVARALARTHFERKQHYGACTKEARVDWSTNANWRNHVSDALAAIEAMREPTDSMIEVGTWDDTTARKWQRMIDDALSGLPTTTDTDALEPLPRIAKPEDTV